MNNLIIKRLALMIGTITPIYAMITVFMPPGFGRVPWMGLVLFVFAGLFISVCILEKSPLWNGVIAFTFWLPMVILHIMQPGTEAIARGEVHVGVIEIFAVAAIHGVFQCGVRYFLSSMMRMEPNKPIGVSPEGTPDG